MTATLAKCVGIKFPKAGTLCSILQLKDMCTKQGTPKECAVGNCEWNTELKGKQYSSHSSSYRNQDVGSTRASDLADY